MSEVSSEAKKTEASAQNDVEQLLKRISDYEKSAQSDKQKINQLENDLKKRDAELSDTKQRLTQLEDKALEVQNLKEQRQREADEVDTLKTKSEDMLTRAKEIIFEKTKVIKNQELQIEALNQQVDSLKEVVSITKDLLEIRNMEVRQLEGKIKCMEERVVQEKERQDLMHKKLEAMIRYNGDLKREYEAQLCLFSALRERYSERELARGVVDDLQVAPAASSSSQNEVTAAAASAENQETAAATNTENQETAGDIKPASETDQEKKDA